MHSDHLYKTSVYISERVKAELLKLCESKSKNVLLKTPIVPVIHMHCDHLSK